MFGLAQLDTTILNQPIRRLIGSAGYEKAVEASSTQATGSPATLVAVGNRAGQRRPAHDRQPAGWIRHASAERTGHEAQQILGAQRIDARDAIGVPAGGITCLSRGRRVRTPVRECARRPV
jgi:hypothetical protein